MQTRLTTPDANLILQQLVELPVSLPWKGYGSDIFLELGELSPVQHDQNQGEGQASISIRWDWRVESGSRILYGSSNSNPWIARGLEHLLGAEVKLLSVQGEVPELDIEFSNGHRLISSAMVMGGPAWSIRLLDSRWMTCADGVISIGDGDAVALTDEARAAYEHAAETAQRWGTPIAAAVAGRCGECRWFAAIDAPADLLDYGVCTSSQSPFDGRAVNFSSGCGAFLDRVEPT